MGHAQQATPPLTGRVVLDLSGELAGAYASKLLADSGATVVFIEPPEGAKLRRWRASGASVAEGESGPLFDFLAQGAHSVVVDPTAPDAAAVVQSLVALADAVIWSPDSPIATLEGLSPNELEQRHPHAVVVAITPFGLTGPWKDNAATEFTLQAWSGGIIGLGRGSANRAPFHVGGRVGEYVTGAWAAVGVMAAWESHRLSGRGGLVDVSMLEVVTVCLTYYPVTYNEVVGRPWRSERSLMCPGVSQAKDGLIGIVCGTLQQRQDLCVMVGHPEWIADDAMMTRRDEVAPVIAEWIAQQTVAEVSELAMAFRVPHAPVGSGASIPQLAHVREREVFVTSPDGRSLQPRPSYRPSAFALRAPRLAPAVGENTQEWLDRESLGHTRPAVEAPESAASGSLPYAGVRVLDFTAYWAGPTATHAMALLGADVIHVESIKRPDGGRLVGGVDGSLEQWWEHSPIHLGGNAAKKSLTIDFQTEEGKDILRRLVETADVVVENFTPRVFDSAGLDYEALREINPGIIMTRMPGFGLTGPWRDVAAFAYAIEDAGGLTWLTGHPQDMPVEPSSLGDPNAGVHALFAITVALEHRRATGEGTLIEAPMIEAAVNIAAEQFIEHSLTGTLLNRTGNRHPVAAPQNLYPTVDIDEFGRQDVWLALSIIEDSHWLALRDALGSPVWALDPDLDTVAGRRAAHDLLDERIGAWTADRTADEIVELLWPAGIPVAKVMQPHRQLEVPQYAARGFHETVHHPVVGEYHQSTLPLRWPGRPDTVTHSPAPTLGQHNEEILAELGVSTAQLKLLESAGVIGSGLER